jgi:hypothetical protein
VKPQEGTFDISKLSDNIHYQGEPGYVPGITFDLAYTSLQSVRRSPWTWTQFGMNMKQYLGSCAVCRDKGELVEISEHSVKKGEIVLHRCVYCDGVGKQPPEESKVEQKVVYQDSQHTGDNIFQR